MHLVEGSLSATMTLLTNTAGIAAVGIAYYGVRQQFKVKQLPSLLATSICVFIAQMLNFSTGFGFSGHLVGAALLTVLFGPFASILSMGVILLVQALLLGDGSISTLGANFLTMGVTASAVAWAVQNRLTACKLTARWRMLSCASVASILATSVVLAAIAEVPLSGMLRMALVWAALEAGLSVVVLLIAQNKKAEEGRLVLTPLALACVCGLCLLPFSSEQPDGLDAQMIFHEE